MYSVPEKEESAHQQFFLRNIPKYPLAISSCLSTFGHKMNNAEGQPGCCLWTKTWYAGFLGVWKTSVQLTLNETRSFRFPEQLSSNATKANSATRPRWDTQFFIAETNYLLPHYKRPMNFNLVLMQVVRVRAHFGQSNFPLSQHERKKEILLILIIFTYF